MRISDWSSDVCSSDLKRGAGQISAVSYNAPVGTLSWWQEHLIKSGVTVSEERERFGQKYLSFEQPDCGVGFELNEQDTGGQFEPLDSPYVPQDVAMRGFQTRTAPTPRQIRRRACGERGCQDVSIP